MNESEQAVFSAVVNWRYCELTGREDTEDALDVVRDTADRVLTPLLRAIGAEVP